MTDPAPQPPGQESGGSVIGAILLAILGVLFLLSTGCFGVFGVVFLADGQKAAWILVICGLAMGTLTYFTFRGAQSLFRGSAAASKSADTQATGTDPAIEAAASPPDELGR